MAEAIIFNMSTSLETLVKQFEQLTPERITAHFQRELENERVFFENRLKENVPYKTGNLARGTKVVVAQRSGVLGFYASFQAPYAVEVHEKPGELDGSTPEGGRGPRFFTRVSQTHRGRFNRALQRAAVSLLQFSR